MLRVKLIRLLELWLTYAYAHKPMAASMEGSVSATKALNCRRDELITHIVSHLTQQRIKRIERLKPAEVAVRTEKLCSLDACS